MTAVRSRSLVQCKCTSLPAARTVWQLTFSAAKGQLAPPAGRGVATVAAALAGDRAAAPTGPPGQPAAPPAAAAGPQGERGEADELDRGPGGSDGDAGGAAAPAKKRPRGRPRKERMEGRQQPGTLHLIVGPMFAGKTTRLLQLVSEHRAAGRVVQLVKSAVDTRYAVDEIVTHDGARAPCEPVDSLRGFQRLIGRSNYQEADVIAIDEAQFIVGLGAFCRRAADLHGKTVIVAGLDGDFRRQKFGEILELIPAADTVEKLSATCERCKAEGRAPPRPAPFTWRTAASRERTLVGGADAYVAVCRDHFTKLALEAKRNEEELDAGGAGGGRHVEEPRAAAAPPGTGAQGEAGAAAGGSGAAAAATSAQVQPGKEGEERAAGEGRDWSPQLDLEWGLEGTPEESRRLAEAMFLRSGRALTHTTG